MNVHHIEATKDYIRFLQANPSEIDALFKELLIGVTSFFRDPDAFEALAKEIAQLLSSKPDDYVARVWVPGCSTGEEAYSIAVLFRECMEQLKRHFSVQIFATDLDSDAIDTARSGLYPDSIAVDVAPKRLARFFIKENSYYRVKKDVRDMLIFATQNLIEDPPFTKLDLLSCRNVLIYLDARMQRRLLPLFHYALKSNGVLLLGSSESIGNFGHLFGVIDRKWKIFRRKDVDSGTYLTEFPAAVPVDVITAEGARAPGPNKNLDARLPKLAEKLMLHYLVPPSVLFHERGDIVHIYGRTGRYLEPAPGPQTSANLFNMAREGLEIDLAAALRHAAGRHGEAIRRNVRVKSNGDTVLVDLRVIRVNEPAPFRGLYLLTFEPSRAAPPGAVMSAEETGTPKEHETELLRELRHMKESHQSTIEELATANEELKSTNEELQSTNEELQSTNEELETSKEEMQSLNEELQTVNAELQGKVEELSHANDDMKNLLNGTDIATLFLDNDLNIKRYAPQTPKIISLIPSDIGRPIRDLVPKLQYNRLPEDAQEVLCTLVFKEVEIRGPDDTWYLMRMLPYRTTDNLIDGLVITFVDITKTKLLQERERRLQRGLESSSTTVLGQDTNLRITWISSELLGSAPEVLIGKTDADFLPAEQAEEMMRIKRRVLDTGIPTREQINITIHGEARVYDMDVKPEHAGNQIIGITCVLTDITVRR